MGGYFQDWAGMPSSEREDLLRQLREDPKAEDPFFDRSIAVERYAPELVNLVAILCIRMQLAENERLKGGELNGCAMAVGACLDFVRSIPPETLATPGRAAFLAFPLQRLRNELAD